MADIIQAVNCNLQWRQRQTIYAKQGDYGARKIKIFLYDGSNAFDVSDSGLIAIFAYRKADGTTGAYNRIDNADAITLNTSEHTATVKLHQQVLTCPGPVECELQLFTSNSQTTTFTFEIYVEKSVAPDAESRNYYNLPYYVLPSGGIPKTDLAAAVQASLNKADTAMQLSNFKIEEIGFGLTSCNTAAATTAKEAYIANYVPTHGGLVAIYFQYDVPANATLNISNTGAGAIRYMLGNLPAGIINSGDYVLFAYHKSGNDHLYEVLSINRQYLMPSGGIPKTDLASAVQTSLDKADSALQPAAQATKTAAMTQAIGIDSNGKLWTKPGESGGGGAEILTVTISESGGSYSSDTYNADIQDAIDDDAVVQAVTPDGMAYYGKAETNSSVFFCLKSVNDSAYLIEYIIGTNSVNRAQYSIDNSSLAAVLYTAQILTDNAKAQARSNIGATEPEVFRIHIASNSGVYSMDCTWSDISAAITAGKVVLARFSDREYYRNGDPTEDGVQLSRIYIHSNGAVYGESFTISDTGTITHQNAVRLDTSALWAGVLSLSSAEKAQARSNIAAPEAPTEITLGGTTVTIAEAEDNTIYDCGEVTALTVTARATGAAFTLIFDSPAGSTPTVLTMPSTNVIMPANFTVEVYTHYEINVDKRGFAVVAAWSYD